jgi:hypothetical protein
MMLLTQNDIVEDWNVSTAAFHLVLTPRHVGGAGNDYIN